MNNLLPCPFCGGNAVENYRKVLPRDVFPNTWAPGEVNANIICTNCRSSSGEAYINTENKDPTNEDVEKALEEVRNLWNTRIR